MECATKRVLLLRNWNSVCKDSVSKLASHLYLFREYISKKIGVVFRSNRAINFNMKNRLFLILTTMITLTLLMASCLQVVPSAPEESATPALEPVVEIPPAEQVTPNWVYAIIGIGVALTIVVIVYIFRSRKP